MKKIVALMIAVAAMVSAAQAGAMDDYSECWSSVSVAHLNTAGTSEQTMGQAVMKADQVCEPQKNAAARSDGAEATQEMRDYMEVALYRANPV